MELNKEELKERREFLLEATAQLKSEFVGLDTIIDELMNNIEPWFLLSEYQMRPTVVNLWGMTGVGKTSLIKRYFELLGHSEILYRFDVGEYASTTTSKDLKYEFSEELSRMDGKPIGFVFDEFQLSRTIDENGQEIDRTQLRPIWDILDSGKIEVIDMNWSVRQVYKLIFKLQHCMQNGLEVEHGKIVKGQSVFEEAFGDDLDEDEVDSPGKESKGKKSDTTIEYIPSNYLSNIISCDDKRWLSKSQFVSEAILLDIEDTIELLTGLLKRATSPKECDFSKSIIFVIGNLDEAYHIQGVMNPDSDADFFYEHSLKITVTDVKDALIRRFRAEQIARLGNNHVIYPAFSSDSYKKLIELELDKVKYQLEGVDIHFTDELKALLYAEGVFPTQGARPVFTSINFIIRSYIPRLLVDSAAEDFNAVFWDFDKEACEHCISINNEQYRYPVVTKIEDLRKSTDDDEQLITAVHESGHAIVSSLILGVVPKYVYSRSAGTAEGFCHIEIPDLKTEEVLKANLAMLLGGIEAEREVFSIVSQGSSSDIDKATSIALEMVKVHGMGNYVTAVGQPSMENQHRRIGTDLESFTSEAKQLLVEAQRTAASCLKQNEKLLYEMSSILMETPKIEKEVVEDLIKKYAVQPIPERRSFKDLFNAKIGVIRKK